MKVLDKTYYTFDDVLIQPQFSDISSRENINTNLNFLGVDLTVPIISSNMDYVTGPDMAIAMAKAGGLGILHRFTTWEEQLLNIEKVSQNNSTIALSVGTRSLNLSIQKVLYIDELYEHHNKIVCIDVAHGHHEKVISLIWELKNKFPHIKIIAGNVATGEAAHALASEGADAIKVGIGPGSVCTTRIVTGVGVPQLSAILDVADALKYKRTTIIADGGIRTSGDIVKALGAGADVVMLGNLLAGTRECPGEAVETGDGRRLRKYRGQSIFGINGDRYVKEGVSGYVEEKGPVAEVLKQLVGGLRSGMSYVGAKNLEELKINTTFIPVTALSLVESNHRMILSY